jgi:hypothetical protein
MRTRRDNDRFLDLIASVCFLRQYQKKVQTRQNVEYIECDLKDYEIAYNIMVNGVLASTMTELPKGAVELYDILRELSKKLGEERGVKPNEVTFTQREVREKTGLGQTWVKLNLRHLVDFEYIEMVRGGSQRTRGFYRIKEDEEITKLNLDMVPTAEDMKKKL